MSSSNATTTTSRRDAIASRLCNDAAHDDDARRGEPRDRASAGERARTRAARLRRALCACAALGAACAVAAAALGSTQMVLNARLSEAARRATPERGSRAGAYER